MDSVGSGFRARSGRRAGVAARWLAAIGVILAGLFSWGGGAAAQSALTLTINGSPSSLVVPVGTEVSIASQSNATIYAFTSLDCSGGQTDPGALGAREEFGSLTQPFQLSFQATLNGESSACLWVRWREASAVPILSINGSTGPITVPIGTDVTASLANEDFLQNDVLFFNDANCSGSPLYQAPGYLTTVSYQHNFTGSFQGVYTDVTEDYGQSTIAGYAGSCIPVTWAYDGLGGVPATPVPDAQGPILVAAGSAGNDSGSGGEPVVALPNTGAGSDSPGSLPWIAGGAIIALASLAIRERRRSRSVP